MGVSHECLWHTRRVQKKLEQKNMWSRKICWAEKMKQIFFVFLNFYPSWAYIHMITLFSSLWLFVSYLLYSCVVFCLQVRSPMNLRRWDPPRRCSALLYTATNLKQFTHIECITWYISCFNRLSQRGDKLHLMTGLLWQEIKLFTVRSCNGNDLRLNWEEKVFPISWNIGRWRKEKSLRLVWRIFRYISKVYPAD